MARVPTISGGMVERRGSPAAGFQPVDMTAGGREIGAAAQRLGASIADFGEAQDDVDRMMDDAGAKALDVQYSDWSRQQLYTGQDAFYTKEGFGAANSRPTVEQAIRDQKEALLGRATSPRMRQMLSDALERRVAADLEGVARHSVAQLRVEERRQSASRIQAAGEDAVTYADDPDRLAQELAVGQAEIRTEAARSGMAPEAMKAAETEFVSGVFSNIVRQRIARGDIEGAHAFLEANREKVSPDAETQLDATLRTPLIERRADAIVDELLAVRPALPDDEPPSATPEPATRRQTERARATGSVLSRMTTITAVAESGDRDRDRSGRLITSPAGAKGRMQVMPGTNRDPGFGVAPAKDGSDAERARVGRDYLAAMMARYGNDPAKAWAAYNWGPGALDAAIAKHGEGWLRRAPAETQAYVRANMAALGGRVPEGTGDVVQQAPREHDMTALLRRVDALNLDFDTEQAVRRQLVERVGVDEQLLRRDQSAALEDATKVLDAGMAAGKPIARESAIPQAVWNRMSPSDRLAVRGVIERNAKPEPRKTDFGTYTMLSDEYARDPAAFARRSPATYRNQLSDEDYQQVMGWRRDALTGGGPNRDKVPSPGQVTHSRIRGVIQNAIQGAGLSYAGLKPGDREGRAAIDRRVYQLENAISRDVEMWQRANPGKEIGDLEIAQIADRKLIRWAPAGEDFDAEHPRFWFEVQPGEAGRLAIPANHRTRLIAEGRRILGRVPTDQEIAEAYRAEARGGR